MFLSEVWAEAHWADAHIQLPEWSDYRADFGLLNGRVYPDTIAPNGSIDPFHPRAATRNGDLIAPDGLPRAPVPAALVAGELQRRRQGRAAVRQPRVPRAAMTLAGIRMRVVGRDATPMRGRDGTDTSYETDTINIGPGESFDVIFTAPAVQGPGAYDTYMLYNRSYTRSNNLAPGGFGGQATEIRVYPERRRAAGTIRTTGGSERHDEQTAQSTASEHPAAGRRRARALVASVAGAARAPWVAAVASSGRAAATAAPAGSASSAPRERRGRRDPTFNLTTKTGYISLPDGNTAFMWGYSSGVRRLPAPRPGALRQRGRHGHRDPAQHAARGVLDRLPRPGGVLANGCRPQPQFDGGGTLTSLTHDRRGRAAARHLQLRGLPPGHVPVRVAAPTPRSRCGWACSAR